MYANERGLLAGAAVLILALATPARAQNIPDGSYLETCRNIEMHGDTLVADCLRVDGRWSRTGLDLDRCRGDIANWNGQLACHRRGHHRDDYGDRRYDEDRRWPYDR